MLDIDVAIKHCLEVAEDNETKALRIGQQYEGTLLDRDAKECRRCAADHKQLAEWLKELKQWRRVYGICPSYEMCIPECKEGYNAQIAEYKRLLKLAIEDIDNARHGINCGICGMQSCDVNNVKPECKYRWQYADEALKLIES